MKRLFRLLLLLFPASFRREYGPAMLGTCMEEWRHARGGAKLALVLHTIADMLTGAVAVQASMVRQDLRFTVRSLRRTPSFALTAIVVTALGVGANSAAFSIADFVLLRPLPFDDADRLVRTWAVPPGGGRMEFSPPNFRDYKAAASSYQSLGAFHGISANLSGTGEPQRVEGAAVTQEVLPMLGVQPMLGRLFTAADEIAGVTDAIVVSHAFWQSAFGGDSGVLGRRVLLGGDPRIVVGVMPEGFHFPNRQVALWTAMPLTEARNEERDNNWFQLIGRLRPGVTVEQAAAEGRLIARDLAQRFPAENEQIGITVHSLRDELSQQSRLLLLGLCGAAACILLIACTNLANLLLARTLARQRELLVRTALGAGRERLTRQLLTESFTLAFAGGALGVLVALAAVPLLARLIPATLPVSASPSLDFRMLLAATLAVGTTGLLFGTVPALRAAGGGGFDARRAGTRSGTGPRSRLRAVLVASQVMATVVLLVTSGLLVQALLHVQATDPGFDARGVTMMRTALPMPQYATLARRAPFYGEVLARVRALPGVSQAAYTSFAPMVMGGGIFPVDIAGKTEDRAGAHVASLRFTTPGFFGALGVPLRRGRDLAESDDANAPAVAVVSQEFATRYWPGENALGKRFTFAFAERTVVGVVGDVRVRGLERRSEPQVYLAYRQVNDSSLPAFVPKDLVIRSSTTASALLPAVRRIVHAVDPQLPVSDVQAMSAIIAGETASRSVQVYVLGGFAVVAFLLAAVGIHGLLSFGVSNRRHEIGVRMALGARRGHVVRMVVRQGALLALGGVVPGMLLAYLAARAMQALLVGVRPHDSLTYAGAVVLCAAMTLSGSLLPALRAVRVSPATALRSD